MKLDLNTYALNRSFIQDWYRQHSDQKVTDVVSLWATATHCPCIALAFYIAEDIGYTPELTKIIDRLMEFYDYEEILNQLPGSPYLTNKKLDDIKD